MYYVTFSMNYVVFSIIVHQFPIFKVKECMDCNNLNELTKPFLFWDGMHSSDIIDGNDQNCHEIQL